ncbi:lysylphosphatidylglycerol synthase domain-containing protein [Geojedonia litorea]|uniref:Lysylphosphatidylglycerol synthase domain-containing protein n=1 Tax=Geojedonia litorea TaxID=1268269 RepID=A0ABV9N8G8_9FLAO
MNIGLPYKTKQFFFVLIKLSLVFGAFYAIYKKLSKNNELDFEAFIQFLNENDAFLIKNLGFLLILSSFNWFFEILKWQKLVSVVQNISFSKALEQSLGSFAVSIFTPNRLGEYGAKAIYFEKSLRAQILYLNLMGNLTQMISTMIFGSIGLIAFAKYGNFTVNHSNLTLVSILLGLCFILMFILFKKRIVFKKHTAELPNRALISSLMYSILRYLIFSFQFYVILYLFGIRISYFDAMTFITLMYLMSSFVPSILIFDVVIKGSIAVYLFSYLGISSLAILSTVSLMWFLNFAVPSLIGSYYILVFKLNPIQQQA